MMKLVCLLLLCATAGAFEYENTPLLQPVVTYRCDDLVLADSFLRMFAQWNGVLDQRFTLTPVQDGPDILIQYANLAVYGYAGATFLLPIGQRMTAVVDLDPQYSTFLDRTMLHELGHVLGMAHSEDLNAIMTPSTAAPTAILQIDDILGVCERYGVVPPSTAKIVVQVRHLGARRYKFAIPQLNVDSINWDFSDGISTDLIPIHKFKRKGNTVITARVGALLVYTYLNVR